MEIINVIIRSCLFYIILLIIYKIMGKREVGQLGVIDLSISLLISQIIAIAIENYSKSIWLYITPIITLVLLEIVFTYLTLKVPSIDALAHEKPSVIIKNGKLMFKEMIHQRYALEELLTELRKNKIKSIEEVEYAILEEDGNLSVFEYDKEKKSTPYPLPLILDGKIDRDTLFELKKDDIWLSNILNKNNVKLKDVFYAFFDNKTVYIIKKSELRSS